MKLEPPNDLDALCVELHIGLKRRARLAEEKGEDLIPWLRKLWLWHKRQDDPEFLHRHATAATPDYVGTEHQAMWGELGGEERVPSWFQKALSDEADKRGKVLRATELRRREVRSINKRLIELSNASMRLGVDVSPIFERVKRELAEAERKVQRAA